MLTGNKDKPKGKAKKKGRIKVLNLNKETLKDLSKDERKRVAGATIVGGTANRACYTDVCPPDRVTFDCYNPVKL